MSSLILNSGSSSIKAAVFTGRLAEPRRDVRIEGIGEDKAILRINQQQTPIACDNHETALDIIFEQLAKAGFGAAAVRAVGHRVVHGGEKFINPTIITDDVEDQIESLSRLAPLHNPACLAGIRAARRIFKNCPHIAVFDTAFHATLPSRAKYYALPQAISERDEIRRFGFHGINHAYVAKKTAEALACDVRQMRTISCHLGNGCSITAIENGRCVDTSMGMTPLEGLVMGTRSGDIDPGVIVELMRKHNLDVDALDTLLNQQSGLLGMTGTNNMSLIEKRAADGDEACRRAIQVFAHRARKYVGAYAAAMGGVDAIVFTAGIGENSAAIRHRIAQRFDYLGATLDEDRNRDAAVSLQKPVADISAATSRVKILIIAANEEFAIAEAIEASLNDSTRIEGSPQIPIAVSARHVHLNQATIEALFGPQYELTPQHPLSQPGQFASKETISLIGPKNRLDDVRILGPARSKNQIEISRSDEFFLGIDAPVRASGDVDNTPGITLAGPKGLVRLDHGVICALRHIHMHTHDAENLNVNEGDIVTVSIDSDGRDLTFNDVLIRTSDNFALEMHIDTDEANAAGFDRQSTGTLIRPLTRIDKHARVFERIEE